MFEVSAAPAGFIERTMASIKSIDAGITAIDDAIMSTAPFRAGAETVAGIVAPVKAVSSAVGFVTDIPRVVTTVLGLFLVIVGVNMLART